MSAVTTTGFIRAGSREEWLANRRGGIGASDVAAILGVNPYRSAFQVWAEKTGNVEPDDLSDNEAVEFGIRLEAPIAQAYADRSGRQVAMWPQYQIAKHLEHDWLRCTPDATQHDDVRGDGLVQIKTTAAWNAKDWEDGPPLHYQCQVQAELAVMNADWATLVVLIGGNRLRYFEVERNQRFVDAMIPKLAEFWAAVTTNQPPEVDGSVGTAKVLAKLFPDDSGEVVELPDEAAEWADTLETAKATIKEMEALKTDAENHLKAAIGNAAIGLLPDGSKYSWKTQHRKGYVVEPTSFRVLRKLK